ncbi:Putative phage abortive infection protein [Maribacter dokdonensis]|uniref:putative phage abortive infection protein n=1 Tax=Maribacter dokdonensis TaxID=320912 RepID=UPI001B2A751C|nr:putative phage abortive infection protein [Maribacter dokdonensis]CAG2533458.1 Putative phage abortive infection protein [Maribacter dokdonensis]
MKNILTEKFSKRLLIAGVVLLLIGFIMFVWNDWSFSADEKLKADKVAQFGDFVGGLIGSIWALAGVILFYVALTEQRKDFATNREVLNAQTDALKQQIKEFELQREELSETRKVFKIQSETLKKQQFESTFFNLVNLHHGIVNSIDLRSKENKYGVIEAVKMNLERGKMNEKIIEVTTGRDCFVKFCKGFRNEYRKLRRDITELSDLEIAKQAYKNYYKLHQSDLGHYFRNLYHIFKFIKNSEEKDKKRYTSLVRAQLSNDELFLLFYNGISEYGSKKFLPLIEEFHILKNLNLKDFIEKNKHSKFYKKSAYGE